VSYVVSRAPTAILGTLWIVYPVFVAVRADCLGLPRLSRDPDRSSHSAEW